MYKESLRIISDICTQSKIISIKLSIKHYNQSELSSKNPKVIHKIYYYSEFMLPIRLEFSLIKS